jgi:hypothetical protein
MTAMMDVTAVGDVRHSRVRCHVPPCHSLSCPSSLLALADPPHVPKQSACSEITQDAKRKRHPDGVEHGNQVNHFLRHRPADGR